MKRSPGHKVTGKQALKPVFLAILSGILLSVSFPGVEAAWLAWIAFIPLFSALEQRSRPEAFFLSYLFGIVFWGLTVYWLVHVTLLGTVLLVLYLSLFFGLFGLLISWYASAVTRPLAPYGFLLYVSGAWVVLEYIRSHLLTGFPWALVGYSQYQMLPVIQFAAVTGAWGVSFLVLFVNAGLYVLSSSRGRGKAKIALVCGLVMALSLGYGYLVLRQLAPAEALPALKVTVIQANIPQELKWNPAAQDLIIQKYFEMSREALQQKPHLLIWPEAAVPVVMEVDSPVMQKLADFARENSCALLTGAVTARDSVYFNSALLFRPDSGTAQRYDKIHLVPFGEYIPLKNLLPFLETFVPIGDMLAGKEPVVLETYLPDGLVRGGRSRIGVLICFEDVFPEISRAFVRAGAHFLVTITNDAWYKKTPAARQHFQASVFRAVENRKFLARCANTGVSGFIGPHGKIFALVQDARGSDIFVTGSRMEALPIAPGPWTLYTRFGDWFIIVCICTVICIILWERRKVAANP